ncbi:putative galacturan 1,4-alpha-galacturonidase [Rosa chinensis]|uniref:Putative galacturan 1,4-alpha-galacturonidase n=1 Tax=Rosa chinensis TaxID=74649 RepID=A0A2P6QSK1_ROSCH|nr:putative galacturan 1,4-alpha-galacturonidase [Rosa chinensis]
MSFVVNPSKVDCIHALPTRVRLSEGYEELSGLFSLLTSVLFSWIVASPRFGIGPCYGQNRTLNILDFSASGDGISDATEAFLNAWKTLCETGQTLNIPAGKTFVVKPLQLVGPCKSNNVGIQALNFHKCDQLQLSGFTSRDSARAHIFIHSSSGVRISNIHLSAPEKSPNTDGIDISLSSQVTIQDSFIGTGQDPATTDNVEQVHFQNCICNKSTNCARIKTWMTGAVKVSNVTFSGITGTSSSEQAITLDCSDLGCTDILMDHVNITSASGLPLHSVCNKASGKASFTSPPIPCLSSNGSLSSVIAPISVNLLKPNHSYLSYIGIHAHKTIEA